MATCWADVDEVFFNIYQPRDLLGLQKVIEDKAQRDPGV